MKIADMPSGPDMDRLVAEKVMGWKWGQTGADYCGWGGAKSYPGEGWNRKNDAHRGNWYPSSDIANAWDVVEHMNRKTGGFMVQDWGEKFLVGFGPADPAGVRRNVATADAASLAICRAALLAVGCEVVP